MLSPQTIKLILAIAIVGTLLMGLGGTMKTGRTVAKTPITRKMLRRHDKTRAPLTSAEAAFLRSQEQQEKEEQRKPRTLKLRDFKDLPLAVSKVKNLDSDTWHRDLQIEVRNTSSKPIYSILADLQFPDDKVPDGVSGIGLRFGERKYIDIRRVGDPQDPHLNPGDSYVFTIPVQARKGLKIQHERGAENFKRIEILFTVISFGDGTGFEAGDFTDYRNIRIPAQNKNHHTARSAQQEPKERLVGDGIPKHVPIKVKLKAEKEAKIKDLTNADWVRDFELEVTNTSDKPIYFLEFWLMLPDTKSENNNPIAFSLRYGRVDFIHFNTRPIETDVPIHPGETYTFTIPEPWQQGWHESKLRRNVPDPRALKIEFVQLSFGDGTGFNGTDASPYPYKREQSQVRSLTHGEPHGCTSTVAFRSSLPQPTTAPRTAVATDLTIT